MRRFVKCAGVLASVMVSTLTHAAVWTACVDVAAVSDYKSRDGLSLTLNMVATGGCEDNGNGTCTMYCRDMAQGQTKGSCLEKRRMALLSMATAKPVMVYYDETNPGGVFSTMKALAVGGHQGQCN